MDAERSGIWAVVHCFGQKFIGKIEMVKLTTNALPYEPIKVLTEDITSIDWVCLSPVYDYLSPIRPVQATGPNGQPVMGMTRDQLVLPFENMLRDAKHWTKVTGIDLFSDMTEEDRQGFFKLIEQVEQQKLVARAEQKGIALASGGAVPPPRRSFHG